MMKPSSNIWPVLALSLVLCAPLYLLHSSGQAEDQLRMKPQQGMLVLTDGRILTGQIQTLQRGYLIESESGRITIPFANVTCFAQSLPEAYRIQRDAMVKPTADQHVSLAEWCLTNKLFSEAEREINSALALQPQHGNAKRLLERFDKETPKQPDFTDRERKETMDQILIAKEFSTARPIANLEPALAREFVTSIEPLLMNRCSNTSCHGTTSPSDFRLTQKWNIRGQTRHISDQNLQAVLGQINPLQPEQSPLLAILR
ncbi:MAG: hypothetical protein KDA78_12400, partial [Planctomycetaceae bacterium]|nr:hypothetical protein [Planctomycetaceae bacterium]